MNVLVREEKNRWRKSLFVRKASVAFFALYLIYFSWLGLNDLPWSLDNKEQLCYSSHPNSMHGKASLGPERPFPSFVIDRIWKATLLRMELKDEA